MLGQLLLERRARRDGGLRRGAVPFASPSFAAKPMRCTLPVGLFGISLTTSTWRGTLKSAMRLMANWRMSFGVTCAPGRNTMADSDVLTQRGVGDGKGDGLRHGRMLQKYFVDFLRRRLSPRHD